MEGPTSIQHINAPTASRRPHYRARQLLIAILFPLFWLLIQALESFAQMQAVVPRINAPPLLPNSLLNDLLGVMIRSRSRNPGIKVPKCSVHALAKSSFVIKYK